MGSSSSSSSPTLPPPPLITQVALAGTSNAAAAIVTNPIDVVKIRLQMHGENNTIQKNLHLYHGSTSSSETVSSSSPIKNAAKTNIGGARETIIPSSAASAATHKHHQLSIRQGFQQIYSNEGLRGYYRGLTASIAREMSYSGIRMGLYEPTKLYVSGFLGGNTTTTTATSANQSSLMIKVVAGAITGCIGSALANPFDLVKVRMQSSPGSGGRNVPYTSILDAFRQIIKNNEGGGRGGTKSSIITGLWRGSSATIQRATLLTASQVPSYDHFKHFAINNGYLQKDTIFCHFISSMVAGVVAAIVTSPIDLVKSRVMIQPIDTNTGNGLFYPKSMNTIQVLHQIIKTESGGIFALYKGFHAQWLRIGPHTTISLMIFEQLRHLFGMNYL